jgi:hypothetical protein
MVLIVARVLTALGFGYHRFAAVRVAACGRSRRHEWATAEMAVRFWRDESGGPQAAALEADRQRLQAVAG